jgi:prepilin-type N-terminal cleavage/methylation domain-containing protein
MIRRAFTLVELLIVIGILVLMMGILLPTIGRARKAAVRSALQADLQAIVTAISAYQADFGDIPRPDKFVPAPFQGSEILCWALLSPGPASMDGADGLGFRKRGTQGQVYGPYLSPDHFRWGTAKTSCAVMSPNGIVDSHACIADRLGNAIFYFPAKPTATTINSINDYFAPPSKTTRYASKDNDPAAATGTEFGPNPSANAALNSMRALLPGVSSDGATIVDPSQVLNLPYLLWDAGPDGRCGSADDVTNFRL